MLTPSPIFADDAAPPEAPAPSPSTAPGRREVRYTLYLSPEELATLRERAARTKTPALSAYIRQAALGRAPAQAIPTVNQQAYRELARLAANLNQVAHHLNQGAIVTVGPGQQFSRDIAELTELVRRLRLDLTNAR